MAIAQASKPGAEAAEALHETGSDIEKLRKDIAALARLVGEFSRASGSDINERVHHLSDDVIAESRRAIGDIRHRMADAEKTVEANVREHPLTWFLGAVGIGALLALLLRRAG